MIVPNQNYISKNLSEIIIVTSRLDLRRDLSETIKFDLDK